MEAHRRHVAAMENRIRLMNPALFIVFITVMPHLTSSVGINPKNPAPGMALTTFRAIKIAARCLWPLNNLGLVSGLAAMLVLVIRTPLPGVVHHRDERVSVVFLKVAYISTFLSLVCLLLIRVMSSDTLLSHSGLCFVEAGGMLLVSLYHFFRLVELHG